jgi:RimJ/RimL family protein N-acetyltransferase
MISLRPVTSDDALPIVAAVHRSRDALRRWMAWYRDDYDVRAAEEWIEHTLSGAVAGTDFHFAIVNQADELIGIIGFEDMSDESGRAMLGYWLATDATGRGIGRRAIAIALEWARSQPRLRVVWALVADANLPSCRVLEANGFRIVGTPGVDERGDSTLVYELELPASTA